MKSLILSLFLAAFSSQSAFADPGINSRIQCKLIADRLMRELVSTPALKGKFFQTAPAYKLVRKSLPDGEFELWETYTYANAEGDNTVTVKLARGLCELREILHNVPL